MQDHLEVAKTLQKIGRCKYEIEDYQTSLEHFEQARSIVLVDDREISKAISAQLCRDLGLTSWKLRKMDEALKYFDLSLGFHKKWNSTETAHTMCSLGDVYLETNSYNKAEDIYKKSLVMFRKNDIGIAEAYHKLGIVYWKSMNETKAMESFSQALKIKIRLLGTKTMSGRCLV